MRKLLTLLCLCPALSYAQVTISLVQDIVPGATPGTPRSLTVHSGTLYMYAGATGSRELYKYDGNNCTMVQDLRPNGDIDTSALGGKMLSHDGVLYLMANDGNSGREMYKYDGTAITQVSDIYPGAGSSNAGGYMVYGNKIYFGARDTVFEEEMWGYNLQTGVTSIVHDEQASNSMANGFTPLNNKLYFNAFDVTSGHELRCYDPQNNSYTLVHDLNPGLFDGLPSALVVVNNKLYFTAKSDTHGREIYEYTGSGTPTRLTDINVGLGDGMANTTELYLYNGALYFTGNDGTADSLYRYDLQSGNVSVVYNKGARDFEEYGGKLYFTAEYGANGKELCVYDGSSVTMIEDLNLGTGSSDIRDKTVYNNEMYFSAYTPGTGIELYKLTDPALSASALEKAPGKIELYPDPATDQVNIMSSTPLKSIEVFSIDGQRSMYITCSGNNARIDLSGLSTGIYMIRVNGTSVHKMVKQ